MSDKEYFTQEEKNYFTQIKINDIDQAKQSWSNFNKYRRNSKYLYIYSKYYSGKMIFNSSMITENLNHSDFV